MESIGSPSMSMTTEPISQRRCASLPPTAGIFSSSLSISEEVIVDMIVWPLYTSTASKPASKAKKPTPDLRRSNGWAATAMPPMSCILLIVSSAVRLSDNHTPFDCRGMQFVVDYTQSSTRCRFQEIPWMPTVAPYMVKIHHYSLMYIDQVFWTIYHQRYWRWFSWLRNCVANMSIFSLEFGG